MDRPILASRLAGAVWGHLVGDATGVPYEFSPAVPASEIVFGASGTWHQPPGTWSDDGALMLALLDSLLTVGFDPEDQGRRSLAWYSGTAYTPDGDRRFDVGGTTSAALEAIDRGTKAIEAGPSGEHDCGNGSLMRILPVALVERDVDPARVVEHAHLASRVTHGHPRCQVACALYTLVVRALLGGKGRLEAMAGARQELRRLYAAQPELARHLAALDELEASGRREGTGYVLDAFWSAWDAFESAGSYAETIRRAIAYGNDTDTTAAIAGGLAGAFWGWEGIERDWLGRMRGHTVAEPLVDRLVETTGARTSTLDPLRVDEIDLAGVPAFEGSGARLGITFLPGKKRDGWTGLHWRDLEFDLDHLRELRVDVLFLLVEDVELEWCLVEDLPERAADQDIELVRFPIRDPRIPTDEDAFRGAARDLVGRLRGGAFVAIACRGGLDRSGLAAACLLVEAGLAVPDAVELVHRARQGSLTLPEQLAYVDAYGESAVRAPAGT